MPDIIVSFAGDSISFGQGTPGNSAGDYPLTAFASVTLDRFAATSPADPPTFAHFGPTQLQAYAPASIPGYGAEIMLGRTLHKIGAWTSGTGYLTQRAISGVTASLWDPSATYPSSGPNLYAIWRNQALADQTSTGRVLGVAVFVLGTNDSLDLSLANAVGTHAGNIVTQIGIDFPGCKVIWLLPHVDTVGTFTPQVRASLQAYAATAPSNFRLVSIDRDAVLADGVHPDSDSNHSIGELIALNAGDLLGIPRQVVVAPAPEMVGFGIPARGSGNLAVRSWAGIQANDTAHILAFSGGFSAGTIDTPGGWTLKASGSSTAISVFEQFALYEKQIGSSDLTAEGRFAPVAVTFHTSTENYAQMFTWRGPNSHPETDVAQAFTDPTPGTAPNTFSTTPITIPSVNTTVANTRVIRYVGGFNVAAGGGVTVTDAGLAGVAEIRDASYVLPDGGYQLSSTTSGTAATPGPTGTAIASFVTSTLPAVITAAMTPGTAAQIDQPVSSGNSRGMGAASDHVVINLTIQSTGLARNGYGIPGILSHNAPFAQRSRSYSSIAAFGADFASTTPEYRMATVIFAQTPKPRRVIVLRATGTVLQQYDIGISQVAVGQLYQVVAKGKNITDTTVQYVALANLDFAPGDVTTGTDTIAETAHGMVSGAGPFRLSTTGTLPTGTGIAVDTNVWIIAASADTYKLATSKANALAGTAIDITAAGSGTHTLRRGVNDVIIAQLVQGLTAAIGSSFTVTQQAGSGETDTLRAVATSGAAWCSLEIIDPDLMSNAQTHAAPSDVTLATDLAAILKADAGWYCLLTNYNSSAYVQAAETWVEANGRTYVWDSCDTAVVTTVASGGTDVGAQSLASGHGASMGCYHPSPADFEAAGAMGRWLPTDPGKATPKFRTLAQVRPVTLTDTHKVNLRARRMNSYEQVVTDRAFFWEGTVFSQVYKFLDARRNSDWIADNAQKAILGVLVGSDIVPETPAGVSKLAGALRGVGALGESQGVLRAGWTVQAPDFDSIQQTDLDNRNLPGLTLAGAFAGAIHTVIPVDVNLTF